MADIPLPLATIELERLTLLPDGRVVEWEALGDGTEPLVWVEGGPGLPGKPRWPGRRCRVGLRREPRSATRSSGFVRRSQTRRPGSLSVAASGAALQVLAPHR